MERANDFILSLTAVSNGTAHAHLQPPDIPATVKEITGLILLASVTTFPS